MQFLVNREKHEEVYIKQRKEITWKYLEECGAKGWLINSKELDLRTTLKSRVTLGCALATNCDPVNFFRVYYFIACKGFQDNLGFWIQRLGFRIPGTRFQSLSVELGPGVRIRQAKISRIQDSLTKKFPGLWNKDSLKLGELLRGNHTTFLG